MNLETLDFIAALNGVVLNLLFNAIFKETEVCYEHAY